MYQLTPPEVSRSSTMLFSKLSLSSFVLGTSLLIAGGASADDFGRDTCSAEQKKLPSSTLSCPSDNIRLQVNSDGSVRRICGGHDQNFSPAEIGGAAQCYVVKANNLSNATIYYKK